MAIVPGTIGLAEPSTLTKKVASVVITRNSSGIHQEILTLGDPSDSNAYARVLAAKPASTEYAVVVRSVEAVFNIGSTAADNSVTIGAVTGNRINIGSTAADNVVRALFSSTNTDNVFRPVFSSTGADNPVVITAGNSSVTITAVAPGAGRLNIGSTAADNAVLCTPVSTAFVKTAGFSVDSSNSLNIKFDGSTSITIGSIAAAAGRINIGSTAADNVVRAIFSSTNTDNPVRAILSSTNTDNPVRAILSSTRADNIVTVYQSSATELLVTATIGTNLQSTSAPSSASSGLIVRPVIDAILTTASTNAFSASTSLSIQSSGAALRSYVVAYTILSTNAGPHKIKFYSSGTMTWPVMFAAVSSAVSGANLAVSAPAYIFRTAASEALTLQIGSGASTIGGYQVGVSYFRAP